MGQAETWADFRAKLTRRIEDGDAETEDLAVVAATSGGSVGLSFDPDSVEAGDPGARSLSDLGNGRRLVDYSGGDIRYTPGMEWHVWNSEYWSPDPEGLLVQERAKSLYGWLRHEASEASDPDREEKVKAFAHETRKLGARRAAVNDASSDPRVLLPAARWDANPHLLGVRNGVVDLRTGVLASGARENFMTRRSPVRYDPGARNERWDSFLEQATGGDPELAHYLQLAAGYTLTGLRKYECLFLVYGPSGSGKSTFLDVLSALMGSKASHGYSTAFTADVLTESAFGAGAKSTTEYWLAELVGARMLLVSELPESVAMQEDAVKRLTGDSLITARHPAGRPFSFEAQAKLWIGTNHRPWVKDSAMWRRIRAIPFDHPPAAPDPGLKEILLDPVGGLPAALAWAVEGARELLAAGPGEQPLRVEASSVVEEATRSYQKSEDRIGGFLEEETVRTGGSITLADLFNVYKIWCDARNERPGALTSFARKLQDAGETLEGTGRRAFVEGRGIMPSAVPEPGEAGSSWLTAIVNSQ